jgi:hypothetical protein
MFLFIFGSSCIKWQKRNFPWMFSLIFAHEHLGHFRKPFPAITSSDDRGFKRALFTLSLDIENSPQLLFYSG